MLYACKDVYAARMFGRLFQWMVWYHAEPYQQYDRVLIGVSVLSIFKQYRMAALNYITRTALLEARSYCGLSWRDELINMLNLQIRKLCFLNVLRNEIRYCRAYLIPIKICAPLIFVLLACAKIKGSKFAQYECAKIKGRRKNATNEWKHGKFTVK